MRRKLVVGNWKMNGDHAMMAEVLAISAAAARHHDVDVAMVVPATLIASAVSCGQGLQIGAGDVHAQDAGPYTGSISAAMVSEAGARFTLVGHSERRMANGESSTVVRAKAEAARRQGLGVIVCVGEALSDREAGKALTVVAEQLTASIPNGASAEWLSIAYEPVWSIGTGILPRHEDIAAMHSMVREKVRQLAGEGGGNIRLLYGGSVLSDNAGAVLATADVDGLLVGRASLAGATFVPIIAAASLSAAGLSATA